MRSLVDDFKLSVDHRSEVGLYRNRQIWPPTRIILSVTHQVALKTFKHKLIAPNTISAVLNQNGRCPVHISWVHKLSEAQNQGMTLPLHKHELHILMWHSVILKNQNAGDAKKVASAVWAMTKDETFYLIH